MLFYYERMFFTSEWLSLAIERVFAVSVLRSLSFERMHFFSEEVLLLHECGFYTIERVSLADERMSLAFDCVLIVLKRSCLNYEREASKARRDLPQG
jgi:hypothetical protein